MPVCHGELSVPVVGHEVRETRTVPGRPAVHCSPRHKRYNDSPEQLSCDCYITHRSDQGHVWLVEVIALNPHRAASHLRRHVALNVPMSTAEDNFITIHDE
jgi:hypothetical protein